MGCVITSITITSDNYDETTEFKIITDQLPEAEDIQDVIFTACEVNNYNEGELYIQILKEDENDTYIDSDECTAIIHMKRTKELSDAVDWKQCSENLLKHIFKIDREKSRIEYVI